MWREHLPQHRGPRVCRTLAHPNSSQKLARPDLRQRRAPWVCQTWPSPRMLCALIYPPNPRIKKNRVLPSRLWFLPRIKNKNTSTPNRKYVVSCARSLFLLGQLVPSQSLMYGGVSVVGLMVNSLTGSSAPYSQPFW